MGLAPIKVASSESSREARRRGDLGAGDLDADRQAARPRGRPGRCWGDEGIVTAEEATVAGGLGSAVAEVIVQHHRPG